MDDPKHNKCNEFKLWMNLKENIRHYINVLLCDFFFFFGLNITEVLIRIVLLVMESLALSELEDSDES